MVQEQQLQELCKQKALRCEAARDAKVRLLGTTTRTLLGNRETSIKWLSKY